MTWDYRVFKKFQAPTSGDAEELYEIHEVYYNDNGDICASTEESVKPTGETLEELKQDLKWMLEALEQPILEESLIEYKPWCPGSDGEETLYDGPFLSSEEVFGEDYTIPSGGCQLSEESNNDRFSEATN